MLKLKNTYSSTVDRDVEERLPNFSEFLKETFISTSFQCRRKDLGKKSEETERWDVGGKILKFRKENQQEHNETTSHNLLNSGYVPEKSLPREDPMIKNMNTLIHQLYERIHKLESDVWHHNNTISTLENENHKMRATKRKHEELLNHQKKREETDSNFTTEKKRKERKLTLVDEFEKSQQKANNQVKKLDDFTVDWNGEKFILIDVFSNKSVIVNYYYPLYQAKFSDKIVKFVLEREDYKKLFSTNPHVKESEKKRAWRTTIFPLDFYYFVKQNK